MNETFKRYKDSIRNKNIAVVGLGISNRPLVRYLADQGMHITGFDNAPYEKLKDFADGFDSYKKVSFHFGEHCLDYLRGFDIIFKTPAMRPDMKPFLWEISRGAILTSEVEVLIENCPAKILAITGSEGKTTTTTLIGKMLEEQGHRVWIGGNIGTPLFDRLDEIESHHKVVLELGSFQLQTLRRKSPDIAVVTNISPNHLDFHLSMEEYVWSKKNIFQHQNSSGCLVLNMDNSCTRAMATEAKGEIRLFSVSQKPSRGAFLKDESVWYVGDAGLERLFDRKDILLKGMHNVENVLAAVAAVHGEADVSAVNRVVRSFSGVEHRVEFVRKVEGISFYNDAIGSTPTRTAASLGSFEDKVVLIAGGYDKNIPYDRMGTVVADKVKVLILLGKTGEKIRDAYLDEVKKRGIAPIPIIETATLSDAVLAAYGAAEPGDVVILSPASASYDMFPNFEIKGKLFKEYVNRL